MKFVAAALVGASSAALGPLPGDSTNGFPVFSTKLTASGSNIDANGAVLPAWVLDGSNTLGTVKGYRNGQYILPLQNIKKVTTDGATSACEQMTVDYRSFWGILLAKAGTYQAANGGANAAAKETAAGGETGTTTSRYVICTDITDILKCNLRGYIDQTAAAGDIAKLVDRWNQYKTVAQAGQLTWTGLNLQYAFQFNEDLAVAAQYHSAGTLATDGSVWCSAWHVLLAKDGTEQDSTAGKGYAAHGKCNWMYRSENGSVGGTFKIKETDNLTFVLQYVEFYDTSFLGTNGLMQAVDDAAGFFQGAYVSSSTVGPYLNPWTTLGTYAATGLLTPGLQSESKWTYYKNSANWGAGSVGRARYHTQDAGNMSEYTTATGDIAIFWDYQNMKQTEFNDYNTLKDKFETDKTAFEQGLADRDVQLKDMFKMFFEPAVEIPVRPENVEVPAAYGGPTIDLSKYVGSSKATWAAKATDNKGAALVTGQMFDDAPTADEYFANKIGYLYSNNGASTVTSVGHVFGRLGQGDAALPANASPVLWADAADAKIPHLLLGVYPGNSDDAGITDSAKQTTFTVAAKTWQSLSGFMLPPSQPAATSGQAAARGAEGAKYLALGAASALAIASSLY